MLLDIIPPPDGGHSVADIVKGAKMRLRQFLAILREYGLALRQSVGWPQPTACPAQSNARLTHRHDAAVRQTQRPPPAITLAARYGVIGNPGPTMHLSTIKMGQVAHRILEAVVSKH
jgi:hypothetical protein